MINWRMFGIVGAATTLLALSGCGGDGSGPAPVPPVSSVSDSAKADRNADLSKVIGPFNTDPKLFDKANPCKLVTSNDLKKLFEGTFSNILGTDESPVTDFRANTRACGYSSSNARIDHEGSYDVTGVSLIITTSLDNEEQVLWRAQLDAMNMLGDEHAVMPGADDLIRTDPGWYTARKGQVIIEVQDINSELTDEGAKRILAVALSRLP